MTVLPVTLTIAGAAALITIWIGARTGRLRYRHKVMIGDGGNEAVTARMRAHGNFTEYVPVFLLLLGAVELARGSPIWLWIVSALFIAGRVLHVFGMDRPAPNPFRSGGMALTLLPLLGLALYAIYIPYDERMRRPAITYVEAPAADASTLSDTNGLVRRS